MERKVKQLLRYLVLIGVLILTGTKLGFAEDIELGKIVVTPSRVEESYGSSSQQVDVITSKEIQSTLATDLSEVLSSLNSVNISNYGGVGSLKTIQMRGATASEVLVMVDGRPINSPRDGQADLSMIPVDNIDRVEVVHGPGSSLYGSSAMGGTVNIITKSPPDKPETELLSSFGTFRTYVEQLSNGAKVGNFGYIINGSYQSSQGFRTNSEFNAKNFDSKLEYKLNDYNQLDLNFGFYKNRSGAPGRIDSPDIDDKQVNLNNFVDLKWGFKPDPSTDAQVRFYNTYDRLEFNPNSLDNPNFEFSTAKSVQSTQVRGIDMQVGKQFSEQYHLVTGIDYKANFNDSTDTAKHRYTVFAPFIENQLDLTKDLRLCLNVRIDNYSNFGTQVSPSFSAVYRLNPDIKFHAIISRSFRAPTFNDLYWNSAGMVGNPNLRPEKGLTEEVGVEKRLNRRVLFGINYYHSKYTELIQWQPITSDPLSDWTVKNVGSVVIDGIELTNKITLTDNIDADLGYSFLVARDDKTHKFIIYQPENKANLALSYRGPSGLTFEIQGQYTDKRFGDSSNDTKVKGFYVINMSASKKFRAGFTYFVSIDNLINKKYQVIQGYPVSGFSITNGIKLKF